MDSVISFVVRIRFVAILDCLSFTCDLLFWLAGYIKYNPVYYSIKKQELHHYNPINGHARHSSVALKQFVLESCVKLCFYIP